MAETDAENVLAAVVANALGPRSASGDAGSMEQHSISDQLELLDRVRATTSSGRRSLAVRYAKIVPGGAI